MPPSLPLIAVDWGSTNFRAALIAGGEVTDRIESEAGIRNVGDDQGAATASDFESVLEGLCHEWMARTTPEPRIILSGMIGSREGWVEVPYADTPAGPSDLAGKMTTVETNFSSPISIVPGVRHPHEDGTCDVMRGEETQATGFLAAPKKDEGLLCIPGTHSKWIVCRRGRIESFRTWATGESFQLLSQHSLLTGDPASATSIRPDSEAFRRGLEHSGRPGGWLHHLFLGRTDMLMKRVAPEDLPSLLSGLLIGHEVREAKAMAGDDDGEAIHLIASDAVAPAYTAAFDAFGMPFSRCHEDVHTAGIAAIHADAAR